MRYAGRYPALVFSGLACAVGLVFARPIDRLISSAQALDARVGFPLLPTVLALGVAAVVHLLLRRCQLASAAREATTRAESLRGLVEFGQALGQRFEREGLQRAAADHLPRLVDGRPVWVLIRRGEGWEQLVGSDESAAIDERLRRAQMATEGIDPGVDRADWCVPMIVAGQTVGAIGVAARPKLTSDQIAGLEAAATLLAASVKNTELFSEIRESSARDALTTCFTRRHALDVIDGELRRARRAQQPATLLMFDLDGFKGVNDRYGHLCGDRVLAGIGQSMSLVLRVSDIKCRYGGDEFIVLLPDTPGSGALRVAETLRQTFESRPVLWDEDVVVVTASFGIAEARPGADDTESLIAAADAALYRAKHAGRNRVCDAATLTIT